MMIHDTDIGGSSKRFPETRHSLVEDAADPDPQVRQRAFETLIASYWKPVYKSLRIKWRLSNEDAKDLTQGFFAGLLESRTLERFDPRRAKFRTYLRTCLDRYVSNERKAAGRQKRGGDIPHVPLDYEGAEGELKHHDVAAAVDLDALFHREWIRALLSQAVDALRRQSEDAGRHLDFVLFQRYDLEGPDAETKPTYAALAREHDIEVSKVTNTLHAMRRRFRDLVLAQLRATSGSEAEYREEVAALFGAEA